MPRRSNGRVACAVCALVAVCVTMAILGLVGLCLAIWQTVDTLHTNHDLMQLALKAIPDYSLVKAFYVFIAFTLLSTCCGGLGRRTKNDDDASHLTTCCGVITSAIMISGYMAAGLLARKYEANTLPVLGWGMNQLLSNKTYLYIEGDVATPEYSNIGMEFNYLQVTKKCCGVTKLNGQDYVDAKYAQKYNITLPYACCVMKADKEVDPRSPNLDDVLDHTECLKRNSNFFHKDTCLKAEHDWLHFKSEWFCYALD
ncbi:hypothetical protein CAPTEDRAFT_204313 [Capitella teleta]|uniref:Tetraspanin n=1 Tax=Capitella teleta TaxID=283909 RepID=R7VDJ7_CAPTE|nr:hypothetical protein CAPTEDRAFT_204313 [Capitella teleta]|eukprot:ELU14386.1 hypothetical protein CAPTEDRAFT_204313 [Capitella teleta]